jgi:hypothetical protein
MLKEAIEYVVGEARDSQAAKVFTAPQEPEGVYYLQKPDGTVEKVTADAPLIRHTAADLSAVVEFAADGSEIWYSREKVVCVIDRDSRRESVTLTLELSPQLKELQKLEANPRNLDQRQIVYLLRTTFRRCLGRAGNLLDVLRSIRFNSQAAGEGVVQHGKASIGKTLKQEITGTDNLPEYFVLEVPVFTNASLAQVFPVECALEPDAATQSFKIIPLPNEIEGAVAGGERMIAQLLSAALGDEAMQHVHYGKA